MVPEFLALRSYWSYIHVFILDISCFCSVCLINTPMRWNKRQMLILVPLTWLSGKWRVNARLETWNKCKWYKWIGMDNMYLIVYFIHWKCVIDGLCMFSSQNTVNLSPKLIDVVSTQLQTYNNTIRVLDTQLLLN